MEFNVKKKTDITAEITFKATADEIEAAYEKAYINANKKTKIPGFRPGKAPLDLVKKHLGESVIDDAANILVSDAYEKVYDDIDPSPVSVPSFKVESFDRSKGASFSAEYEFLPDVKISKYKKVKVEQGQGEFEDSIYNQVLGQLQEQKVILSTKNDAATDGDVVTLNLVIKHGKKEMFRNSEFEFDTLSNDVFPGLKEAVLGQKAGDSLHYETDVDDSFPDKRYAGKNVSVSADVVEVRAKSLPELTDEFAAQVSDFQTLADLKADIKSKISATADEYFKNEAVKLLLQQVLERNSFPVPKALIHVERNHLLDDVSRRIGVEEGKRITIEGVAQLTGQTVEKVETDYNDSAASAVRQRLILDEIGRLESIEVTNDDIEKIIRRRLDGSNNVSDELIKQFTENEELVANLKDETRFNKVIDWLYDNADVKKGAKVSIQELINERKIRI